MRERANACGSPRRLGFDDYWELVRFSAEEPERFWPAAIEDMGLEFSQPWEQVVRPLARAGVGDLVRRREAQPRLELRAPLGARRAGRTPRPRSGRARTASGASLSYRELSERGDALRRGARAARRRGRATASRSSCRCRPRSRSPRTPARTSARSRCRSSPASRRRRSRQRLQDSEAKVVVTADGSLRRGREVPMKEIVDEAVAQSPSVEHVVVWRRLGGRRADAGRAATSSGTRPWRTRRASSSRSRSTPSTRTC